jgi:hypothetical protein
VRTAFEPAALARPQDLAKPRDDGGNDLAAVLRSGALSMSGVQEKLVLYRRPPFDSDVQDPPTRIPEYRLPVAGAPSTVLVKRERGRFPGLVQNEIACMDPSSTAGFRVQVRAKRAP